MTTPAMIEKVARALCLEEIKQALRTVTESVSESMVEDVVRAKWKDYESEARAAMDALMEPTEYITGEGEDADHAGSSRCGCPECDASQHGRYRGIWQAMLRAAMGEVITPESDRQDHAP